MPTTWAYVAPLARSRLAITVPAWQLGTAQAPSKSGCTSAASVRVIGGVGPPPGVEPVVNVIAPALALAPASERTDEPTSTSYCAFAVSAVRGCAVTLFATRSTDGV